MKTRIFGVFLGLLSIIIVFYWSARLLTPDRGYKNTLKDVVLIDIFSKNKFQFEKIREMMLEDGEQMIIPDEISKKLPFTRSKMYSEFLRKIGNPTVYLGRDRVKYVYAGDGNLTAGSGWSKGINYDTACLGESIKKSIDDIKLPTEETRYCRHIEGNWWVSLDIWL